MQMLPEISTKDHILCSTLLLSCNCDCSIRVSRVRERFFQKEGSMEPFEPCPCTRTMAL